MYRVTINCHNSRHLVELLLFALLSAGLCCDDKWLQVADSCYKVYDFHTDYSKAKEFCQGLGGDLGAVENAAKSNSTVLEIAPGKNVWLKEGTQSTPAASGDSTTDLCPFAFNTTVNFTSCSDEMRFVCQIQDSEQTHYCPKGLKLFRDRCLAPVKTNATLEHANTFCELQKSKLAVFDDGPKAMFVKSMLLGNSGSYWVGVKKETDGFKWSNGVPFQHNCTSCTEPTVGDCVVLVADDNYPTNNLWNRVSCSTGAYALCESPAILRTTVPPATTEVVFTCPHGYNWKAHEDSGFCFWETTYETNRMNWFQARDFCRLYGGDLASYKDLHQEEFGLGSAKGHSRGMWIGLKRGIEDDVFRWSDGSSVNYVNWNYGHPKLGSRSKFCVKHGVSGSKWELDYCGVRRWFVCKAPKVSGRVIPEIPAEKRTRCNFTSASAYNDWRLFENHCYLLSPAGIFSWDTARTFCEDNNAYMASVHSFNETDFILSLGSGNNELNYWIGLHKNGFFAPLTWVDGTPYDFVYWDEAVESDDTQTSMPNINFCVTFNDRDGSWRKSHCNHFERVICKRGVNSSYEFTSPPPTPILRGFCPSGFYTLGNKCYKAVKSDTSVKNSWRQSSLTCASIGATLVSIHSQTEQDFLTDILLELGQSAWTGLVTEQTGLLFKWTDNSKMDYTNWDDNEPSTRHIEQTMQCVEMVYNDNSMGKWKVEECSSAKVVHLCQVPKDPTLVNPPEDLFACTAHLGWFKLGSSCFGFFEEKEQQATWLESQARCRQVNSNLMSIRNFGVTVFLTRKFNKKDQIYWSGMRESEMNKYEWLTGYSLTYANWLSGQPQRVSQLRNCVAVTSEGKWMVRDCNERHSYVCEWETDPHPTKAETDLLICKEGWESLADQLCYIVSMEITSWYNAVAECHRKGGSLASFHSQEAITAILPKMGTSPRLFHIGLGQVNDGSYAWLDKSPLDFTNWDTEEPDGLYTKCVAMSSKDGKWFDQDCSALRRYICSTPKEAFHIPTEEEQAVNSSLHQESRGNKIEAGGIVGIVICLMVILAIAAVASYYMCPSTRMRAKILEPDSP